MKRLTLVLIPAVLALPACDLDEKSLGDTGASDSSDVEPTESDSGDSSDPSDSNSGDPVDPTDSGDSSDPTDSDSGDPVDPTGNACTEIGCEDAISLALRDGEFYDGNYQVSMFDGVTREQLFSCDFGVISETIDDADCNVYDDGEGFTVNLPIGGASVSIEVLRNGDLWGSLDANPEYSESQPNGPGCEPICTQASLTLDFDASQAATCGDLQTAFDAEHAEVRGCTEAAECGQVIEGFSCGCTRAWVGRLDANLDEFYDIGSQATTLECEWAFFGSTCDCPETDGFACVDNICTWNYL